MGGLLLGGLFDEMADIFREMQERYGFTHVGTMPGNFSSLVWGCVYPEPDLFVAGSDGTFEPVDASRWAELTHLPPPWPFLPSGQHLDFAHV